MTKTELTKKKCIPCSGHMTPLTTDATQSLLADLSGWTLEGHVLKKQLRFKNFVKLIEFVNRMAALAEVEGHHPNFYVNYNIIDVSIWTHAIDDLTENDFILAAKIDGIKKI